MLISVSSSFEMLLSSWKIAITVFLVNEQWFHISFIKNVFVAVYLTPHSGNILSLCGICEYSDNP